jgi:hypothetical protein
VLERGIKILHDSRGNKSSLIEKLPVGQKVFVEGRLPKDIGSWKVDMRETHDRLR